MTIAIELLDVAFAFVGITAVFGLIKGFKKGFRESEEDHTERLAREVKGLSNEMFRNRTKW